MFSVQNIFFGTLGVLGICCLIVQKLALNTENQISSSRNPDFLYLQRSFFIVYFLALFSDWLQGPYVYKLYSYYGFPENDIAVLYLVGFASSIVFGTFTGSLADRYGRKLFCVIFAVLYAICCLTKISPDYYVLFVGRLLGGIATSILFSSFESWYVHEHVEKYKLPIEWISVTFSTATFFNGLLAIAAGIVANAVAENFNFGPVAPFILAVPCLVIAGILAVATWPENRGYDSNRGSGNVKASCFEALRIICTNPTIALLGLTQACFESVMYIFVFLWTPILDLIDPPLGIVFACFMVCVMLGSSIYSILLAKQFKSQQILIFACVLVLMCSSLCMYTTRNNLIYVSFGAFLVLETAVGMYFPAIGFLRSEILPENYRANLINWFRIPMNASTSGALLWLYTQKRPHEANSTLFTVCTCLMLLATLFAYQFSKRCKDNLIVRIDTINDHYKLVPNNPEQDDISKVHEKQEKLEVY